MRGKVECRFIGGPNGSFEVTLLAMACQVYVSVRREEWLARVADGSMVVMKGNFRPTDPWHSYLTDVYEKQPSDEPGCTYKFAHTETVSRCMKVLELKGRRCKNNAEPGSDHCKVHL